MISGDSKVGKSGVVLENLRNAYRLSWEVVEALRNVEALQNPSRGDSRYSLYTQARRLAEDLEYAYNYHKTRNP